MNEEISRRTLADIGVEPLDNLNKSILLCKKARRGLEKGTPEYALTLMHEGNSRVMLVKLGMEPLDNLNKAELMFFEARDILKKTYHKINLIKVNSTIGDLKYFKGEMQEAYKYLKVAIELIENIRTSIKTPELRKEYFETVVNTYKTMVFTCLSLEDKEEEAFSYAEATKGRTFLELLANDKKRIHGNSDLIKNYKNVLEEIGKKESMLLGGKEEIDGDKLQKEVENLKKKYDFLLNEIQQSDPEYYVVKTVKPIGLERLSKILEGRTLVEYFLGKKLAIFILNSKGFVVKEKDINETEIFEKVAEFRKIIEEFEEGSKAKRSRAEEILKDFYNILIEPVKYHLSDRIVIVPHSYLHYIPFQALKGEKYLIEDYNISFAQSASSLEFLKSGTGKGAVIVGNPTDDSFNSETEAIEIGKKLKTRPILRDDAKKDRVMKRIENKEILHFSCHGKFDNFNPAFSRVILSDGSITAIDFIDMDMNANVTVLSACETALAKISRGDEVEGLVRSIQFGGCRFVIASLWQVADKSTKDIFVNFYDGKGDITDRIKEAEVKQINLNRDFYFWAPFQVYGI